MASQPSARNQDSAQTHDTSGYGRQSASTESRGLEHQTTTGNERERGLHKSRETGRRSPAVTRQSPFFGNAIAATPFSLMRRITDELDRIFQEFGVEQQTFSPYSTLNATLNSPLINEVWRRPAQAMQATWSPRVDVFSRGNHLLIRADLPGLTKEDVTVEVGDGVLTIQGEHTEATDSTNDGYYFNERNFGTFYRSLPIPEGINPEQIQASFRNGILEINMPNPAASEQHRRKVSIQG